MENQEDHNQPEKSSASNEVRMYKSNLFQASQNAQKIFDYLSEGVELEEWMKSHIVSASEELKKTTSCQTKIKDTPCLKKQRGEISLWEDVLRMQI
jgi:hypothetical protein